MSIKEYNKLTSQTLRHVKKNASTIILVLVFLNNRGRIHVVLTSELLGSGKNIL